MSRPAWEMADVIARFGEQVRQSGHIGAWQKKTLTDLGQCRTALLGGHVDACTGCGQLRVSYNSCRNRNCPKCQSLEREAWILGREVDLLPVVYYHVVFTMPSELNGLCLRNPRFMYDTLFDSAWATLQKFAADPKGWVHKRAQRKPTTKPLLRYSSGATIFAPWASAGFAFGAGFQFCGISSCSLLTL